MDYLISADKAAELSAIKQTYTDFEEELDAFNKELIKPDIILIFHNQQQIMQEKKFEEETGKPVKHVKKISSSTLINSVFPQSAIYIS
jgi:hypothetical protein